MGTMQLITEYLTWHYGQAVRDIWELEKNFLWFSYHFFSIPLLLKTLFAPFYRIRESYKGWSTFEALMENAVANAMSRVIGAVLRLFLIGIGIAFQGTLLFLLIPALVSWILLPFISLGLIATGAVFLIW